MSEAAEQTPEGTPEATQESAQPQLNEQEQAALEKARSGLSETNPNVVPDNRPQRPEGIPEKFWDAEKGTVRVEDLAKSYAELEKRGAAPEEPTEEPGDEPKAKVGADGKIQKAAEEASEEAENPLASLLEAAKTDFTENQTFGEETATKLAEAGIPVEVQQVYLAGLEALSKQQSETIQGYVGGEDNYAKMAQWAGQHLSDDELDAFNTAIDNPKLAENAVLGLYSRYQKARPSEGRQVSPQNGAPSAGDIFRDRADFTQALKDPRYQTDATYRRDVVEKLARTRKAGVSVA